ncbi:WD40 repeat-like protein [Testicularia cyperi]|uniref:WD repeat-containing protein JIP5 n=1 Tax=Testicularia cyperi TaxID=1882483 RepID=A0A317XVI3_9BASI|nr:WD40 repeat-like protein [Testicularia cyperi]
MDIPLTSDALDLSFHPSTSTNLLAVGLISGKIQLCNYDDYANEIASSSTSRLSAPPSKRSKVIKNGTGGAAGLDEDDEAAAGEEEEKRKLYRKLWNTRPSKKSCRGLAFTPEGDAVYSVSKDKSLFLTDTETGKVRTRWLESHDSAPSRVLPIDTHTVVTGDDDGVVRLWDQRKPAGQAAKAVREYDHHFDWITDFLYMPYLPEKKQDPKKDTKIDKKKLKKERRKKRKQEEKAAAARRDSSDDEDGDDSDASDSENEARASGNATGRSRLIVTSGDGTLSTIDLRMSGAQSFEQSEDQEDELLSVTAIKNSSKLVVGTQLGILSLWAPTRGLLDHVDRIPGHPASVDAICTLDQDTVLTGSADGLVRVVQILPSKLLGVIADHQGLPVERMKRKENVLATIGHSNTVKFTDLTALLDGDDDGDDQDIDDDDDDVEPLGILGLDADSDADEDDDDDIDVQEEEDEEQHLSDQEEHSEDEDDEEDDDDSDAEAPEPTSRLTSSRQSSKGGFFADM